MKQHVMKVCQTACNELKRLSSVRSYRTEDATKKLVTSCVLSRLDYCNSLLTGTPNSVIQPMQKVRNSAARLILRAPRHQHCTPFLQQLHWLPISERIKYKSLVPPPLIFLNYCSFSALPALSVLRQTHYVHTPTLQHKTHGFRSSVFTSGTTSPKMSDTLLLSFLQKQTQDISVL